MRRRRKRRKQKGCAGTFLIIVCVLCLSSAILYMVLEKGHVDTVLKRVLLNREDIPYQEITVEEKSLENKYYYSLLSEEDRIGYQEIVQGVQEVLPEIYIHCGDAKKVNQLFQDVLKDFPEMFWCEGSANSTSFGEELGAAGGYTVLRPNYTYVGEEKEQKQKEIEAEVTACLSQVSAEASDYDKILYVYEYIVNAVEYDLNAADNQNIYSVFAGRASVCAGYAKATQYLLERLGVFCTYVRGTTVNQETHAWNLVMCDGDYYYVDTTWGDPVYRQQEGSKPQESGGNISYDYLCCNDEELFRTHVLEEGTVMPACTSMKYNYYVVNGMYYDSYESQTMLKAMNSVIASGESPFVAKFANSELYAQARGEILEDLVPRAARNLCDMYGLERVEYYYQDDNQLNKISIYWNYK